MDVWVDGLGGVAETIEPDSLQQAIRPVQKLAQEGKSKVLRLRAKGVLSDDRLTSLMKGRERSATVMVDPQLQDRQETSDEEWEGFEEG